MQRPYDNKDDLMIDTTVTNYVAAGAVSSPLWLPAMEMTSKAAGLALPILGAIWLIVQITRALWLWPKKTGDS